MGQGFSKKNFRISQIFFIENFSLKMHFNLDRANEWDLHCGWRDFKRAFSAHRNFVFP